MTPLRSRFVWILAAGMAFIVIDLVAQPAYGQGRLRNRLQQHFERGLDNAAAALPGNASGEQVPIPKTAAEVPGPASGTALTKEYVQSVGRMAYMWGWPLVANANRAVAFSKVPE